MSLNPGLHFVQTFQYTNRSITLLRSLETKSLEHTRTSRYIYLCLIFKFYTIYIKEEQEDKDHIDKNFLKLG